MKEVEEKKRCTSGPSRERVLQDAVEGLFSLRIKNGITPGFYRSEWYEDGDDYAPFFTEAFLYNLFGKEDGDNIMEVLLDLLDAAGYVPPKFDINLQGCPIGPAGRKGKPGFLSDERNIGQYSII